MPFLPSTVGPRGCWVAQAFRIPCRQTGHHHQATTKTLPYQGLCDYYYFYHSPYIPTSQELDLQAFCDHWLHWVISKLDFHSRQAIYAPYGFEITCSGHAMTEALPNIRVTDPQARNGSPVTSPNGPAISSLKDWRPKPGITAEGQSLAFRPCLRSHMLC